MVAAVPVLVEGVVPRAGVEGESHENAVDGGFGRGYAALPAELDGALAVEGQEVGGEVAFFAVLFVFLSDVTASEPDAETEFLVYIVLWEAAHFDIDCLEDRAPAAALDLRILSACERGMVTLCRADSEKHGWTGAVEVLL